MGNAVVIIQKWSLPVNVSELVHFEARNGIAAHYDYAPFGAVTRAISASAITDNTFTTDNPFRFSSEYHDDTLGLVYYNYRHYNPVDGRWCGRDLIRAINDYFYLNRSLSLFDFLGLTKIEVTYDRKTEINSRGFKQEFYWVVVRIIEEPASSCCRINFIQIRKSLGMSDYVIDNVKNSNEPYYYPHIGWHDSIRQHTNGNIVIFKDAPGGAIEATEFILYIVEVCRDLPPYSMKSLSEMTPINDTVKVLATARLSVGAGGMPLGKNYETSFDSTKELQDVLDSQEWESPFWNRKTNVKLEP